MRMIRQRFKGPSGATASASRSFFEEEGRGFVILNGQSRPYINRSVEVMPADSSMYCHPLVYKNWSFGVIHNGQQWVVYKAD